MPQILSELKLNEVSLVDRPANSTTDPKTGKKIPRAVIALYKRDEDDDHGPECKCQKCKALVKDITVVEKEINLMKAAKGVQFVIGFPGGGGGSKIQSVIFDKATWDENRARKWLTDHNMKAGKVDSTANTIRFRQEDPADFERFRVIQPGQARKRITATHAAGIVSTAKDISVSDNVDKEVTVADKHDYGPDDKEIWKAIDGDPDATLTKDGKCQTQGGKCYPASDYAYVPDRTKPSTWKLRLTTTPGGEPDSGIVGAAAAALGPGFRGKKVQIPSSAVGGVKSRVRSAWSKANPDKDSGEMPDALQKSDSEGEIAMTLEELEVRVTKQDETIESLTKRNELLDAENALVIKMTKGERKAYASMSEEKRKDFMGADQQKRKGMLAEAKAKRREKRLEDSMDAACKAEYDAAGPIQKGAMLEEQARKLARAQGRGGDVFKGGKRAKGNRDTEDDSADDGDDDREDDGEDDGDDDGKDTDREKRTKLRKQLAAAEDRITKSEAELEMIRKRERDAYFVKCAEAELPNTPGSPAEKGEMLQKLADTFGEQSQHFKKLMSDFKNADKVLSEKYSEIGKAARGDIPALAVFEAKVEEISKRDKLDKPHAVEKAMMENPELYLEYERSQRGIVARA
jgi:hypothetical protein